MSMEAPKLCSEESGYIHVSECVPGPRVNLDTGVESLYPGCSCDTTCDLDNTVDERAISETRTARSKCSCKIAYNQDGRMKNAFLLSSSRPVFECNSNCRCGKECPNRVTQRSRIASSIYARKRCKTPGKGHGLFALEAIPRGTLIGEYCGEVLSSAETEKRLKSLGPDDPCYLLQFREHTAGGKVLRTNIDVSKYGTEMRFANHSCSPNLAVVPVRVNSVVPKLCLFACRDVFPDEELCFSYSAGSALGEAKLGEKPCLCGSSSCVGRLPYES